MPPNPLFAWTGRGRKGKYVGLLAAAVGLVTAADALGGEPASPAVEIKCFLNPTRVLDEHDGPNGALRTAFALTQKPLTMRMQFLDGPGHDLQQEGWNIRFRRVQGEGHVELTFKRRYPVEDDHLDAALAAAARDGFDADESDYEPELEWGYQKKTVTFANEKRAGDAEAQDLDLPSAKDARKIVFDKIPDKLQEWKEKGWAKHVLANACVFGPVEGQRWRGRREEIDDSISIEVWALPRTNGTGTESIVEVSFKKKQHDAKAKAKRGKLLEFLTKKRWLLEEDVLKTELILDRSGHICPAPVSMTSETRPSPSPGIGGQASGPLAVRRYPRPLIDRARIDKKVAQYTVPSAAPAIPKAGSWPTTSDERPAR